MWQKILENLKKVAREPVLFVAGAVWLGTLIMERWEVIPPFLTALGVPVEYQTALLNVAGFLVSLGAWWTGRAYTTPVSDPRDLNGVKLTPYYVK